MFQLSCLFQCFLLQSLLILKIPISKTRQVPVSTHLVSWNYFMKSVCVCISIGRGRMTRTIRVIQVTFAGLSGSHSSKNLSGCDQDRSREINSIAVRLARKLAWLNLAFELPFICIYLFRVMWYHTIAVGQQTISLMTAQLASWPSSTKKYRCSLIDRSNTLIEQSQYFQGSIRADPSKLGAVSFVNDLV